VDGFSFTRVPTDGGCDAYKVFFDSLKRAELGVGEKVEFDGKQGNGKSTDGIGAEREHHFRMRQIIEEHLIVCRKDPFKICIPPSIPW
jgi:hypothetical protein